MQYIFGTGISELDDLILNTAGTALGAMLSWHVFYVHRADQSEETGK